MIKIPRWTMSKEEANKLVDELSNACFEYGKDESQEKLLDVFYKTNRLKNYTGIMQGRIYLLTARIAELEAEIDQLTAHDATERQDDKCSGHGDISNFPPVMGSGDGLGW